MKASVIICAYSTRRLPDTLKAAQSALNQTYPSREVVVAVDTNPPLAEALQQSLPPEVQVVLNSGPRGLATNRNVGLRAVSGEVVVYLDDDAEAEPAWLAHLMKHYQEPDVAVVGGRTIPMWEGAKPRWMPEELYWVVGCTYRGYTNGSGPVRNVHGNNMSFRREALERVGGFKMGRVGANAASGNADETELCLRITHHFPNARIIYEPAAVVHHLVPQSRQRFSYVARRAFGEGIAKATIAGLFRAAARPLSSEYSYLRHLTVRYMPGALGNALRLRDPAGNLGGLAATTLMIASLAAGYAVTYVREGSAASRRRAQPKQP
ncbi:MAG: glycosyltransferase family 2 protein [Chloroflexi bacterium]|nr:glycosyltransferase family 2 protein [Chloroflexota bacterium]